MVSTDGLERIKTALKLKLPEYINLMGYSVEGKRNICRCPNHIVHKHGDKNPSVSMWIGKEGIPLWHCHTCGQGIDIFAFARFAEPHLPQSGSGFVTETLPTLCEKLGLEFDPEDISPKTKERYRLVTLNEKISKYIVTHANSEYLDDRGISKEAASELGIGSVRNFDDMIQYLEQTGFKKEEMVNAGIYGETGREMFNSDRLIFTIRNTSNEVIAFGSRDMRYEEKKRAVAEAGADPVRSPKYQNTPTNMVYKKGNVLYNLNMALPYMRQSESKSIYIFEGYTDCTTAYRLGIKNTCGICSSNLTKEQLALLVDAGIKEIILCLDGDDTGRSKIERIVEKYFVKQRSQMLLRVISLPEGMDPDTYLSTHGRDGFESLPQYDVVEYEMRQRFPYGPASVTDDTMVTEFLQWVCTFTKSPMMRMKYVEVLSHHLNIEYSLLVQEMEYAKKIVDNKIMAQADSIWSQFTRDGSRADIPTRVALAENVQNELFKLGQKEKGDLTTNDIDDMRALQESVTSADTRQLITGYNRLDYAVRMPFGPGLFVLGAYANRGKSAFMRHMVMKIVQNNPDVLVLYCSLDDSKADTVAAMVALSQNLKIDSVLYPTSRDQAQKEGKTTDQLLAVVNAGYEKMRRYAAEGRLVVKDGADVPSLLHIKEMVEIYSSHYCRRTIDEEHEIAYGKKPVLIIDSLHSVMDVENKSGERRENTLHIAQVIKNMSLKYKMPIYCVAELRKSQHGARGKYRPGAEDIAETVKIEYLADVIAILHNKVSDVGAGHTAMIWSDLTDSIDPDTGLANDERTVFPVTELDIVKNKKGYFKGLITHYFNPPKSQFKEITLDKQRELLDKERNRPRNA